MTSRTARSLYRATPDGLPPATRFWRSGNPTRSLASESLKSKAQQNLDFNLDTIAGLKPCYFVNFVTFCEEKQKATKVTKRESWELHLRL
jgi:hypothetical protein